MSNLPAAFEALGTLNAQQWVGITSATTAAVAFLSAVFTAGIWYGRR